MNEQVRTIRLKDVSREFKIDFCYKISAKMGEEVEQPFEDFLDEDLDRAYLNCFSWEWARTFKVRGSE